MVYTAGGTRPNALQQLISIYRANHRSPADVRTNEHAQAPKACEHRYYKEKDVATIPSASLVDVGQY